jgi:hypothetical protein
MSLRFAWMIIDLQTDQEQRSTRDRLWRSSSATNEEFVGEQVKPAHQRTVPK